MGRSEDHLDIVISGYGAASENTIAGYRLEQGRELTTWQAQIEQASFICRGEDYLFTITEVDEYAAVHLLKRQENEYLLTDVKRLEGGALCHITYSAKQKVLYGACYATGTVFAIRVEQDRFGEVIYHEIQHKTGEGEVTRAHCVLLYEKEEKLLTVNIALDQIILYKLNQGLPVLWERIDLPEGVGPRHASFSSDESRLYVITEYSNEIFVYRTEDHQLLQRASTLPSGYEGSSNCSTLCMTKEGRYLYAANRGADTIAQFRVNPEGLLEWVAEFPCGGRHPRHMILTDREELLIICNQHSDNVTAFQRSTITGALTEKAFELEFHAPSGIAQL
jgi:6-phosphogluconolactonase